MSKDIPNIGSEEASDSVATETAELSPEQLKMAEKLIKIGTSDRDDVITIWATVKIEGKAVQIELKQISNPGRPAFYRESISIPGENSPYVDDKKAEQLFRFYKSIADLKKGQEIKNDHSEGVGSKALVNDMTKGVVRKLLGE